MITECIWTAASVFLGIGWLTSMYRIHSLGKKITAQEEDIGSFHENAEELRPEIIIMGVTGRSRNLASLQWQERRLRRAAQGFMFAGASTGIISILLWVAP